MNRYKKAQSVEIFPSIPINELPTMHSISGWLDPYGKFYRVPDSSHTQFIREKLDIDYKKIPGNEKLYDLVHKLGWIRLREYEFRGYLEAQGTRESINRNKDVLKQISDMIDGKLEYHFV